jgi:hypothetical protein
MAGRANQAVMRFFTQERSNRCAARQKKRRFRASLLFDPVLSSRILACVPLAELIDAAASVQYLLFPRIERMAVRAHFDLEIMAQGRARLERVAAAAGHADFFVFRMNAVFHGRHLRQVKKMGAKCSPALRL